MSTVISQTAFGGTWTPNNVDSFSSILAQFNPQLTVLRAWQEECAQRLLTSTKNNRMIVAPTGSGKSIAINYLISHMLHNDMAQRVIVSVPQRAIGGGFTSNPMLFPMDERGDELFEFVIKHDYCADTIPVDSKADAVIAFLRNPTITSSDRMLVCVNNTLLNVYNRLKNSGELHLLKGTAIWFDEAHHIQSEADDMANGLGNLVLHCLERGVSVNVVTATAFRGDRLSIIPSQYMDDFAKFTLPYDRHFSEHCNGMAFTYDFVLHTDDWYDGIEKVLVDHGDEGRKTIIFIPHPTTRTFRSTAECKKQAVVNILTIIKGSELDQSERVECDGVITLTRGKRIIRVIDLVSDSDRPKKVELLRSSEGENVDYVIGINIPKEGFDWPCANREFIIGPKTSLTELMQMMGRTFRGHHNKGVGKENVQIFHLLTMIDDAKLDQTEVKYALNDYLKAVYMSMIGEAVLNPPDVKIATTDDAASNSTDNTIEILEYVVSALGGESQWGSFMGNCMNVCRAIRAENEDGGLSTRQLNELIRNTIVSCVEGEVRIKKFHTEIAGLIFNTAIRRSSNIKRQVRQMTDALAVDGVDFDIMEEVDAMHFMLWYSNGLCNVDTFKELREAIDGRIIASLEQHKEWIRNGKYSFETWRQIGYQKYRELGAVHRPTRVFNISWKEMYDMDDPPIEQYKEWIAAGSYTYLEWRRGAYKKYNGAVSDPTRTFGVSWKELSPRCYKKKVDDNRLSLHKEWIAAGSYTYREWKQGAYKKYNGAVSDPTRTFGVSWKEFKRQTA